ncbi:MAG: glycoside hydrolase family 13 protein, partial [Clostridia bacterium]
ANPKYRELLFGKNGVINKWTGLGVKGWRLDVVDELPIDFTDLLCETIKKADKNALIIGEVWEDASTKVSYGELRPYLIGGQLDGVMNYPFKNAII